jgi:hypothetical protein
MDYTNEGITTHSPMNTLSAQDYWSTLMNLYSNPRTKSNSRYYKRETQQITNTDENQKTKTAEKSKTEVKKSDDTASPASL